MTCTSHVQWTYQRTTVLALELKRSSRWWRNSLKCHEDLHIPLRAQTCFSCRIWTTRGRQHSVKEISFLKKIMVVGGHDMKANHTSITARKRALKALRIIRQNTMLKCAHTITWKKRRHVAITANELKQSAMKWLKRQILADARHQADANSASQRCLQCRNFAVCWIC